MTSNDIAWCPGCGNFGILNAIKSVIAELNIDIRKLVLCSGIGQAAKLPHYLDCNVFNGLHGRALPVATAVKAVNKNLNVIAISGDGDMYGEGGNHFLHAIRRNPSIVNLVNNNMVYGLTKGQASPTSPRFLKTTIQTNGVEAEPFNPIAVAIAQDASFVARAFCGDFEQTKDIIKQAILHQGYALVDIFQPCVTFNKTNTYQWFKENTYYLDETHNLYDKVAAFQKSVESEKLPLGIFYKNDAKTTFEETVTNKNITNISALDRRKNRNESLKSLIREYF